MSGLEAAVIALGTAVVKAACGVWLGDRIVAAAGTSAIDLAARRLTGAREQRRFRRLWDQAAELVADRVEPLLEHEFRGLPENERLATVAAVQSTFGAAVLTEADLFEHDLDAVYLDRHLRRQDPDRATRAGLSGDATSLYDLLLRECCAYAIELARTLPGAGITALTEVLRRERQLLDDMRTVLERLPARRGLADFGRDYRQLVVGVHDQVELFGATLAETSRRYPLSVAYLSLTVSGDFTLSRPGEQLFENVYAPARPATTPTARVEDVLASTRRLFIRGEAGSGKTTLLQWIAVQSARESVVDGRSEWNDTIPFFVALRRHADGDLPTPEQFVAEAGRHIAAEMPDGWVHDLLRSGRAVVLVDGVDELTETRRDEARRWLRELVAAFPAARYVVTSRPAAVPADWLGRDDFDVADLEPMTATDVPVFVHRWHEAMREQCDTDDERAELTGYEERLLHALTAQRHLRSLSQYPLLCALLCALHRDRRGQLPGNRMELYEVALQMLLERRDRERRIGVEAGFSRTDKTLLLRDIAYWLIRNGWTSASADRVRTRIAAKLMGMVQIRAYADEIYRMLLERSGLLREPVAGQTDFVHRTFQEYLAAAEAVATDDIGALIANAYTDLWSDVVVMAAGHATATQRTELIRGLLERAASERDPQRRRLADSLRLLAAACLETSPEVPPDLRREVERTAEALLPPKTMATAQVLARSGTFTLDLLARAEPRTASEVAATIRAAAGTGDPAALPLLARFGRDTRKSVVRELLRAWPRFDADEYARTVLLAYPIDRKEWFEIRDLSLIPALHHLTNLRHLRVTTLDGSPVEPAFVADLPNLEGLIVSDITDLQPLVGTAISGFMQPMNGLTDRPPLSLAPLAEIPALTRLVVAGRRVIDLVALHGHDRLAGLYLGELGSSDALVELPQLPHLESIGIGGMPDLRSLEWLRFLNSPYEATAYSCASLEDVSILALWQETLYEIALERCPAADLRPLSALHHLEMLSLRWSGPLDLGPVAVLPSLRRIRLGYGPLPDLRPLKDSPALAMLEARGVAEVDLGPLAGREGLTVEVDRSATVNGAGRLGAGSRVVRR
jgi:hypothetical protein